MVCVMEPVVLLDAAGRRRSPATLPGHHRGPPPRNKGVRYPADPPTIEEIVLVMRRAGPTPHGHRIRGVIVVLWRAGLRISGGRLVELAAGVPYLRRAGRQPAAGDTRRQYRTVVEQPVRVRALSARRDVTLTCRPAVEQWR